MEKKVKYLILSDIHLSSPVSRSDLAIKVLENTEFDILIINGDLIDSDNVKRLKKEDWKFLSAIRKITKHKKVLFIRGNHDNFILDIIGELIGVDVVDDFALTTKEKRFYVFHGDKFDLWMKERPIISEIASSIYYFLQKLSVRKQKLARFVKYTTKKYLRCTEKIKDKSHKFCKDNKFDGVIVGHTHFHELEVRDGFEYWNTGCFSEADGKNSYITIDFNGNFSFNFI